MNIPSVDNNLYVRTLRSRNIPYDIRHRQTDKQNNRGQKLHIPTRPYSLKTNSKVITFNIPTHPLSNKDMTICNTLRQEHIQIPTPRHNKYARQDKSSSSPPQNNPYGQNMRDRNTTTQPKLSNLTRDIWLFTKTKL